MTPTSADPIVTANPTRTRMTIREQMATAALQGLVSIPLHNERHVSNEAVAELAVQYADALLAKLER